MINFGELPEGWILTSLGDLVITIQYGYTASATEQQIGPKFLRITDLQNNSVDWNTVPFCNCDEIEKYKLKKGDIVIARTGATTGKSFLLNEIPEPAIFASYLIRLNTSGIFPPEYIALFMQSVNYWHQIIVVSKGSAQPGANASILSKLSVPLPPLNEQRRIVAKIEALKARSQRVKEALEAIPPLLDQFRQSVLAAAFRGDLTADWREQNPDVESASVLLERIRAERDKRYQNECNKAEAEGRRKPILFKENIEQIEISNLPTIPDTWSWTRLVNISNIIGGVTKGRKFGNRKTIMLPYLRVANVQDGYLDLNEIKEIEILPEDLEKYHLEYGDILFTEGGDRDKLGRGTIWRDNIKNCIHQNHVYRARLYYSGVSCDYISLVTKSKYAKAYFFANASQTVNLASINLTCLGNLPLPIPSAEEQKEIVYRFQHLFKAADIIEQQYQQAKANLDQLDQSILAKAFRGELVPQDPNDEPASVLLERIRAERAQLEAETKTAKKSTTQTRGQRGKKAPQQDTEPIQLELPGIE